MPSGTPEVQFALPTLDSWHRNLLIGLFVAYVIELLLHNAGVPLYTTIAWWNFGAGFAPWQPITRFVVQGATQSAVSSVLISLFVLYFFLPTMDRVLGRRGLLQGLLAGAAGGTLVPLALDLTGTLTAGGLLGWGGLVMALPTLLGLARPNDTILLLVFPIRARWFLWGTLVVAVLMLLVQRSLDSYQSLGVWLGVVAWWYGLGPGRRRADLKRKASGIERDLNRFRVVEGGKSAPQGKQDDDWVH